MTSVDRNGVFRSRAYNINYQIYWSTGRELNPRILILQTSALATSPPVLILLPTLSSLAKTQKRNLKTYLILNKNPTLLMERVGFLSLNFECISILLSNLPSTYRSVHSRAALWQQHRQGHFGM